MADPVLFYPFIVKRPVQRRFQCFQDIIQRQTFSSLIRLPEQLHSDFCCGNSGSFSENIPGVPTESVGSFVVLEHKAEYLLDSFFFQPCLG